MTRQEGTSLAALRNPATNAVQLRDVDEGDLPTLFEHQLDPDATQMAAFPSRDRSAFMAHWTRIMGDATVIKQTILVDGEVAGSLVSWEQAGERLVGYWLDKAFWGRGVATRALVAFVGHIKTRPLYAHVARHNIASRRVLEKGGFTVFGEAAVQADADGAAVEEDILILREHADE